MPVYPLTSSQQTKATKDQLISFLKSPAQVSRRLGEILAAQEFLSFFLLTMQGLEIKGGAIAIPRGEPLRTDRPARDVAPGAEYPLTTMSREQYEVYTALKKGLSTEVTDEEIGRSARQPIDDAMTFLKTEHIFTQDDVAMAMVKSSVTAELTATSNWTTGKILWKDAERARMKLRQMRLGFEVNTAVLPSDLYTDVLPELVEIMGKDSGIATSGDFPNIGGITWVPDITGSITAPLFTDRQRLGGIAPENIPSPGYVKVGNGTHVEITTYRKPGSDKTVIQSRNTMVPVVVNPEAAIWVDGAI